MNWKKPTLYVMTTGLKSNEKMNISSSFRHYWTNITSYILMNNFLFLIKGSGISPDPHLRPSRLPLMNDPHEEPSTTILFFKSNPHERPSTSLANPQEL